MWTNWASSIFMYCLPLSFKCPSTSCRWAEHQTRRSTAAAPQGRPFDGPLGDGRVPARLLSPKTTQAPQSLDEVQQQSPDLISRACIYEMPRDYAESFPAGNHMRQEMWSHHPKAQGEIGLTLNVPHRPRAVFCAAVGSKTDPGGFIRLFSGFGVLGKLAFRIPLRTVF